jgi:hypothetical protein
LPFVLWDPAVFFGYAPFAVNAAKLGGSPAAGACWLGLTGLAAGLGAVWAYRGRVYRAVTAVLAVVVLATWTTFFFDLTYVQLIFVPALFLAGEEAAA